MFKKLTTFKVVYETKNFSKAAELLFVVQPTVSAQIKQLENELGTTLFRRNGRKEVLATPQADLLYQKIGNLLDDWEDLKLEIQNRKDKITNCNIAASHTFSIYLLPDLIISLKQYFPNISFNIKMMNSLEVLNALEHHDIDFGFIEKPLSAKNIRRFPLFNDQLVLAGNPTTGPWLIREKTSGVYYYTQRYLEENDIQKETMTVQNNEIIIALLKKGFGCAIISQRAAKGLTYQKLSEKYSRQFYLITRDQNASPELTNVMQWIQKRADFKTNSSKNISKNDIALGNNKTQ